MTLPPTGAAACHAFNPAAIRPEVAIALSMIVEITSLIPRVTFSTPAMPAYAEPTVIAVNRITMT